MGYKYSIEITIKKAFKYICFYGFPALVAGWIQLNPTEASLTIGTALTMLSNYLKHKA